MFLSISPCVIPQALAQQLVPQQNVAVAGIKFATPQGFVMEQPATDGIAFLRSTDPTLALFVTLASDQKPEDEYVTQLSNSLVSRLLPGKSSFNGKYGGALQDVL